MNIIQTIKERRSVRSFDGMPLTQAMLTELNKAIEDAYSPFGGNVTIRLKSFEIDGTISPGTYGVIRGAKEFFLLAYGSDEDSALTAGFRFEQIVLKAWQMGLGTCWIAGTFKESRFSTGESWPTNESLRIICPVGVAAKQRVMEKIMRFAVGSHNRRPFSELFFTDNFLNPLPEDSSFAESLQMLRLAPSATNAQPWRILVDRDKVLFYCKVKNSLSFVDMGIGICHFYLTERRNGFKGAFAKEKAFPVAPGGWKYIVSYTRLS